MWIFKLNGSFGCSTQTKIVGDSAVNQVDEFPPVAGHVRSLLQCHTFQPAGGRWIGQYAMDPFRLWRRMLCRVVLQNRRAKIDWKGRRSRHGARDGELGQIGLKQVELILSKFKAGADGQVRGVYDEKRRPGFGSIHRT